MAVRSVRVNGPALERAAKNGNTRRHLIGVAGLVTQEGKRVAAERLNRGTSNDGDRSYFDSFRSHAIGTDRVQATNEHKAALAIENGARPHPINGHPLLFFTWDPHPGDKYHKRSRKQTWDSEEMAIWKVNHPGINAYKILQTALDRVMRRRGLAVR